MVVVEAVTPHRGGMLGVVGTGYLSLLPVVLLPHGAHLPQACLVQ